MTIYILDNDPKKIPEMLDDKSLERMIKDIAQVLCNVHWKQGFKGCASIPLMPKIDKIDSCKWTQWARECKANYLYLSNLGEEIMTEIYYRRNNSFNKPQMRWLKVIRWASDNVPDLYIRLESGVLVTPELNDMCYKERVGYMSGFPLVIPKRHIADQHDLIKYTSLNGYIISYRNYYQAKIEKRMKSGLNQCESNSAQWTSYDESKLPAWTNREKPVWLNI
jgi:hypothetical protein